MRGRWVDLLWLVAVGAASSAWCVSAAAELGATFDEPFYLDAGLKAWRTGSNKPLMSAGAMTLPIDVQTLPVYLWERARGEPFHAYKDIATILPVARAANLAFWWVLLAYAMRLGRTWGGAWGGRIAVGLVGFDPNFLGHAALAATDTALTASMLVLLYHAHHGQGRGWVRRVGVPGVCFGIATLAKASGMVFGVQCLVVVGLWHLARAGALAAPPGSGWRAKAAHVWHATYGLRKDTAAALLVGFTLVFAYTGCDWTVEPSFVTWAENLPDGPARDVLVPVSTHLRVFPNAGEALVQQIKHNIRGHGTYLLGAWYDRATPAYFPVALSMKVPLPALLLILLTLVLRPRAWNTPAGWFALVLLAFAFNCRVQIGVRFLFTLMAVSYVAAACAAVGRKRSPEPPHPPGPPLPGGEGGDDPISLNGAPRTRTDGSTNAGGQEGSRRVHPLSASERGPGGEVARGFAALAVAATAAIAFAAWPHGLGFFNRLWGNPADGYTRLHDSNYDWGQGLPELKAWHAAHGGGRPLAVWYYGTDPAILFPPFRYVPVAHTPLPAGGDELPALAGRGYLAVSVSVLHGHTAITPSTRAAAAWLAARTPVARTHTFFVYDLSAP